MIKYLRCLFRLGFSGVLAWSGTLHAQVVINEVFYHGGEGLEELQWIELHNPTDQAVSLAGWKLDKGVQFTFAAGASLPAHGYAVLCRNREVFDQQYHTSVAGEFTGKLKRSGEKIELRNASGQIVDSVSYRDRAPWPLTPDGLGASLERICPAAKGSLPENWAPSKPPADTSAPGGTPGAENSAYAKTLPPVIDQPSVSPTNAPPGQPLTVETSVRDPAGVTEVQLIYRVVGPRQKGEEKTIPMVAGAGQRYSAVIPGQSNGRVIRFRLRAVNAQGAERLLPCADEVRPVFSLLVQSNAAPGKIPFVYLIRPEGGEGRDPGDRGPVARSVGAEEMMRSMAQRQFATLFNLPTLWASLALESTNAEVAVKLRPVFVQKAGERDRLEKKFLASTNYVEAVRAMPAQAVSYRNELVQALTPLLTPAQVKLLEAWRSPAARGGMTGRDFRAALQQLAPLEDGFYYLTTRNQIDAKHLLGLVAIYHDAVLRRDGFAEEVSTVFNGRGDAQDVIGKVQAVQTATETKVRALVGSALAAQSAAWQARGNPNQMRSAPPASRRPARGNNALVYNDPKAGGPRLFDFVSLSDRHGGYRVNLGQKQSLNGMSVINLVYKESDRWALTEPLSYEMHRRAGEKVTHIDYARLWVDGRLMGYHLLFEQPNKAFLRRMGLNDEGNLYKVTYRDSGLVRQHPKKTQVQSGHDDLIELVDQLERTKDDPAAQWAVIQREFDVEQLLNHYAVRLLLSDWDGFFNNYYLYHDEKGTRKWSFYVWDQDKTWGDYDGYEDGRGPLFNLPLTYGAEGDKPPGWKSERVPTGFRQPGMPWWWRAGGWISKPVLANPIFRRHLMARMKNLIETEFTQERVFPLIDQLKERLGEEVRIRARANREDIPGAERRFAADLDSLKDFFTKRRRWLLQQEAIASAPAYDRAQLTAGAPKAR